MNDRELLELAAKAAGLRVGFEHSGVESGRYDLYWSHTKHQLCWHGKTAGSEHPELVFWNPLTDDGDALRLAVKLNLSADFFDDEIKVGYTPNNNQCDQVIELVGIDPYAATRRAIVRAAAEIGRQS